MTNEKIKTLLLEMGGLLADYRYTWSKEMKSAFNKAVKHLEKTNIPTVVS